MFCKQAEVGVSKSGAETRGVRKTHCELFQSFFQLFSDKKSLFFVLRRDAPVKRYMLSASSKFQPHYSGNEKLNVSIEPWSVID